MDKKKNTATLNLAFEKEEKEKRNVELILANEALVFQKKEKEKLAVSLLIANEELAFQHSEKEKREAEFTICSGKLIQTEKLYQLMVNNVKDYAIINLDAEGCVATWNSGAQYIKGYTEEDIIGKPISIFYTPEEIAAEKPKRDLQLALQHGRFETEGLCVKKDGSTFYANIVYTAIVDGQGLHKEYLKITKDITQLKKAEAELKKINEELEQRVAERTEKLARSEAFNLGVLNSLAPHIAVLNKSGDIVAVNESWKNFAIKNGKASLLNSTLGSNYYAVCEKASKDNIEEADEVARAIEGIMNETIANFYLEYECHSSTEQQWFAIGITKFESDEPMVVVTHTNITERKKTENLLAERENYLRTILETEPACVKILDSNGKLLSMNPAGIAMIEADSEAQVLNTRMVDLINYGYKTSFNKLLTAVFAGNSGKLEFEITGFKGGHLWMETQAVPMKNDGQIVSFLGVTQDITERKKAEAIINESESKYRDLIEQAVDGIVILNQQGKLMQVNGSFLKMIGYEKSEITNMTISDLIPQEETENQAIELKKLVAGETRFYERVFKRKDGTTFIAEVNGQLAENGLLVAFLRDITNRKNAEDEIAKTNAQRRELTAHLQNVREEERQRIAREIHDELGQQLTAIKMDAVWIDKQIPKEASGVKNKLKGILELLDESNESVRKILMELRPRILDNHVLLEALQWQGEQFTQSTGTPIHFTTNQSSIALPQETATCIYRIYQEALTNITRHAEATHVISSLNIINDCIILTIEDDGNGFDTKMVESKKSFGLLGMKERVFSFKGNIDLISTLGKGTKIVISLPYTDLLQKD